MGKPAAVCYVLMMIEHPPVEVICKPDVLLSLCAGIRAFGTTVLTKDSDADTVWVLMENGEYVRISCDSLDLAWKFEVFPIRIEWRSDYIDSMKQFLASPRCRDMVALEQGRGGNVRELDLDALPETPEAWPFAAYKVDVSRRQEGVMTLSGEMEHAADVAIGLLFTGARKGRLLVAFDNWPVHLVVSRDEERITGILERCERMPAADYAKRYLKG